jgi:hypothetical protein
VLPSSVLFTADPLPLTKMAFESLCEIWSAEAACLVEQSTPVHEFKGSNPAARGTRENNRKRKKLKLKKKLISKGWEANPEAVFSVTCDPFVNEL